jgi:hypothetical protein
MPPQQAFAHLSKYNEANVGNPDAAASTNARSNLMNQEISSFPHQSTAPQHRHGEISRSFTLTVYRKLLAPSAEQRGEINTLVCPAQHSSLSPPRMETNSVSSQLQLWDPMNSQGDVPSFNMGRISAGDLNGSLAKCTRSQQHYMNRGTTAMLTFNQTPFRSLVHQWWFHAAKIEGQPPALQNLPQFAPRQSNGSARRRGSWRLRAIREPQRALQVSTRFLAAQWFCNVAGPWRY